MKYAAHMMIWGPYFDPHRMESFFSQAKDAGADAVEFRPDEELLELDESRVREIKQLSARYEMEVLFTFAPPQHLDMRSPDPAIRRYATQYLERGIRCAAELGVKAIGSAGIYACWPPRYDHDFIRKEDKYERLQRSIACIREASKVSEACDVRLNLEVVNRFENYLINTAQEAVAFCEAVDSTHCGILLDLFHMNIEEPDLYDAIRTAGKHLSHFHVCEPDKAIPHSTGRFDWKRIGDTLREIGYGGMVGIEAICAFEDKTYNFRLWRDLLEDVSQEGRMKALKEGIGFLKREMEV